MRTKQEIVKDYIDLLNSENPELKLEYPTDETELNFYLDKINEELYATEYHKGQIISSLRAFYIFCDIVIRTDIKTNQRVWNSFVRTLFGIIEKNRWSAILAPRGSGKSYMVYGLYPCFKDYLIEGFEACLCSNTPKQVRLNFRVLKNIIDNNELLLDKKDVSNLKELTWSKAEIEYNKGLIWGLSIGQPPHGGHPNFIALDDPNREDRKYTHEYVRDHTLARLKGMAIRTKARMVIIGTPQETLDIFHYVMADTKGNLITDGRKSIRGFTSYRFQAVNEKTKEVLVPEVFTYEELMTEKASIGDYRFAREFMCECKSTKSGVVNYGIWQKACDEELSLEHKGCYMPDGKTPKKYVIFCDVATSDADTADYSAFVVGEIENKTNRIILRNIWHAKGVPITDPTGRGDDQPTILARLAKAFFDAEVIVEQNAAGVALYQAVRALGVNATPVQRTAGYASDVWTMVQDMKDGNLVIPRNPEDEFTLEMTDKLKNELFNYGIKVRGGREVLEAMAGKDDLVDALVGLNKHARKTTEALAFAVTGDFLTPNNLNFGYETNLNRNI